MLERVRTHLAFKATLTVVLVLAVSVPFFLLEYFPLLRARALAETALDRWIEFDDRWVWVYVSLYAYMPTIPLLLVERAHLRRYALGMLTIAATAFAVFLLYPTEVPRPPVEGTQLVYRWLVGVDRPSNAVPSLHCAFALFTALIAKTALCDWRPAPHWRIAVWVWCGLICISTLAIKQHLLLDAFTGCALGLAVYSLAWRNAFTNAPRLHLIREPL